MTDSSTYDQNDSISNHDKSISNIQEAGKGKEFIIIGGKMYYKHELMHAFGGTLNPGLTLPPVNKFGNAAPIGLAGFAMVTFLLGMYNAQAMGVNHSNALLGIAAFYGGLIQFLAGCWEMVIGNTFGATALTSYGAFWISYAAINVEAFGITAAYKDEAEFNNAMGLLLLSWAIYTAILSMLTLKSTLAFCLLLWLVTLTYCLLCASSFTQNDNVTRAAGIVGVITGLLAFYNAFAGVVNKQNSYFTVYSIPLTKD
mmetsp:Transcript_1210/g.1328  ORF Transcript_1210/g.1328 Transcript_1210/m.1328 type:complete len:256 (+) Transcript_1210:138-905(+)